MRRAVMIVAAAAVLGGGCARGDIAPKVATRLEHQVSWIRRAAEAGAPRTALARLDTLTETVNVLLEQMRIDQDRALAILDAADDVRTQLALLPAASETFSPSPTDEGNGNHGDGNNGNGQGNGGDGD